MSRNWDWVEQRHAPGQYLGRVSKLLVDKRRGPFSSCCGNHLMTFISGDSCCPRWSGGTASGGRHASAGRRAHTASAVSPGVGRACRRTTGGPAATAGGGVSPPRESGVGPAPAGGDRAVRESWAEMAAPPPQQQPTGFPGIPFNPEWVAAMGGAMGGAAGGAMGGATGGCGQTCSVWQCVLHPEARCGNR